MKMMLLALGCALMLASVAGATDYTFSNGYYWKGGQAFTRSLVSSYDARGCLVNTYQYTPYVAATTTTNITNVTHETPDWRNKLLEIADYQKKAEAKLRQSALEHQEYLEALKALGLNGPRGSVSTTTTVDSYGYSQRPTGQGATVYGYNEIADVYANTDLGEIYNTAMRLAEASNRYGADATNGAFKLVDQLGDRASGLLSQQLAIAEINAKTNGVVTASRALGDVFRAESRLRIEKRVEGPAPPNQTPSPPPPGGSPILDEPSAKATSNQAFDNLVGLVNTKCVSCHGGKTTEAGLSLVDLGKVDQQTAKKILARITHPNPEKRMPPGKPLDQDEIRLFYSATQ